MIKALSGTIWTPMISTRNAVRPLKPKRAVATAARNEIASARASITPTTSRLFLTSSRKKGRAMASWKFCSVKGAGNHFGTRVRMSRPGLKAVATIQ